MSKHSRKAKRMQRSRATRAKWLATWLENEIKISAAMARFMADVNGATAQEIDAKARAAR